MAIWAQIDSNGNVIGELHDDMGGAALSLSSWPSGLTKLTDAQVSAVRAPTQAQQWATYQAQVQGALAASDTTMHRIGEAVALGKTSWTAPDVVTFVQWRQAMRSILTQPIPSTIPTTWPVRPAYPAGT